MRAVLLSGDMMVSSRVISAAGQAGVPLAIAQSPADLAERLSGDTRLVMLDLSQHALQLPDAVGAVRAIAPVATILAFGPHVEEQLLAAAREAGCDEVMSNGQFHREQVAILAKLVAR